MIRALPAPLDWRPILRVIVIAVAAAIVFVWQQPLIVGSVRGMLTREVPPDWHNLSSSLTWYFDGSLYTSGAYGGYRWSPLAVFPLAVLTAPGLLVWQVAHVGALAAFRDWRVIVAALVTWPWWFDLESANVLTFIVLAAWWALRGNRWAIGAFLVMALLIPRPIMLPVLAWILWQHREWRRPFVSMVLVNIVAIIATGYGPAWIAKLASSGSEITHYLNFGPTRWLGYSWLLVGVPLAAWLTWHGRLGLASLAVSPYLLPYYLLFGLLELRKTVHQRRMTGVALGNRDGGAVAPLIRRLRRTGRNNLRLDLVQRFLHPCMSGARVNEIHRTIAVPQRSEPVAAILVGIDC